MNITIYGLDPIARKKMTYELETDTWYDTFFIEGECENVVLNENVILKMWADELMIDFGGEKTFFYRDDFREIDIT